MFFLQWLEVLFLTLSYMYTQRHLVVVLNGVLILIMFVVLTEIAIMLTHIQAMDSHFLDLILASLFHSWLLMYIGCGAATTHLQYLVTQTANLPFTNNWDRAQSTCQICGPNTCKEDTLNLWDNVLYPFFKLGLQHRLNKNGPL